jgi:hypothetical protein
MHSFKPVLAITLASLLLSGCQVDTYRLRADYAAPGPLPAEIAARFAYEKVAAEPKLAEIAETGDFKRYRGELEVAPADAGASNVVVFELFETKHGEGRRPTVLIMPILAGRYPECDYLGGLLASLGAHAFFVHRPENLLDPKRRGEDMERLLRRSVVNVRRVVDVIAARPDVDPERLGFIGISLGAIMGTVVIAAEPRLKACVLVMGGADMAGILVSSRESPVRWYRYGRMDDEDLTLEELEAELRAALVSDPAVVAPYVDARRVLQFISTYDNKVPTRFQWKLWEALGRPEAYACPSGHYTSVFFLDFAKAKILEFYASRLGIEAPPAPPPADVAAR